MLNIMTLNLNYFGSKHGDWEVRLGHLVDILHRHAPDVVALQAVGAESEAVAGRNQAQQLAAAMPEYTQIWFQEAQRSADDRLQGSAYIARTTLAPVSRQDLPYEDNQEDGNRRILLHARATNDGTPLEIVNAHFSWVPEVNHSNVVAALAYLQTLTGAVLLLGDLNATPGSGGMQLLAQSGWTDVWAALRPDDPGFTFEADAPTQRIDYVWANPAAAGRVRHIERLVPAGDARLSDHLGLIVTVQ